MAVVELLHLRLPVLTSEPVLVLAHDVGKRVRHVAGNIDSARGRRQTGRVKPGDEKVRRSRKGCARTEVQAEGFCLEAVIEIVEDLIEGIDAEKQLVAESGRQHRVVYDRIVLNVDRTDFVVVLQIGTDRGDLIAFPGKPSEGDIVLIINFVVELDDAVVTVAVLCKALLGHRVFSIAADTGFSGTT